MERIAELKLEVDALRSDERANLAQRIAAAHLALGARATV